MIENLIQDIKEKKIRNIYYLYGNEKFLLDYYLDALQEVLIPEKMDGINYDVLDYQEVGISYILNSANTNSFLGGNKILVIKNSELISKEKQLTQGELTSLEEYFSNPNPSCFLIFRGEEEIKGLAKSKVAMFFKKYSSSRIIESKKIKGSSLKKWIKDYIELHDVKADSEVFDLLMMIGENGLYNLKNEIDKLILFGNKGEITIENTRDLIVLTPEGKIFELVDAIISKQGSKALKLADDYFTANEPPILLRGMLISSFRRMIIIKDAMDHGYMKPVFKEYLDTASDFLIDKTISQVRKISLGELLEVYDELYHLEFMSRNSKQDQKVLLKDFIIRNTFNNKAS